jgi:exosortase D (VPLPA-CTERM-specific)
MQAKIEKNRLLSYIFPSAILACFTVAYWPIFQKLAKQWSSGDNSYCYLIIPLFLYLLYDKKNSFSFGEFSWTPWGLLPTLLSVMLIIAGELGAVGTLLFIGIWGCVVGLAVTLYGNRTRLLTFPLLILFFIVPLPPFVNQMLTFKFKMAASKLSVMMLRAAGISVLLEGNIIDIGIEKLQVVDACSGLRYFMPMILLTIIIGYFFVKGWWRWAVLLLMIVPLSIIINSIRIWVSALLIINGHPELARSLFHDFSGWLMFMIAGIVLVAAALLLRKMGSNNKTLQISYLKPKASQRTVSVGWLTATIVTIIICVLFTGSGWALNQIPSASNLPQRKPFDLFPMQIGKWHGKRDYLSDRILYSLWSDDYITANYIKEDSSNLIYLFIPFYGYQVTNHTAHAPEACLLGGGFALIKSNERSVQIAPDKKINVMTMVLGKNSSKLLAGYFFLQRGRVITNPWMNKFYLMWDAFTKKRTDGALVRMEMRIAPEQSMDEAYGLLEEFIIKLWPILPEYVPG